MKQSSRWTQSLAPDSLLVLSRTHLGNFDPTPIRLIQIQVEGEAIDFAGPRGDLERGRD